MSRHETRTALIAKKLNAILNETRLADEGSLKEAGVYYTFFFWKGKPESEDKIHKVGVAITTALLKNIPTLCQVLKNVS